MYFPCAFSIFLLYRHSFPPYSPSQSSHFIFVILMSRCRSAPIVTRFALVCTHFQFFDFLFQYSFRFSPSLRFILTLISSLPALLLFISSCLVYSQPYYFCSTFPGPRLSSFLNLCIFFTVLPLLSLFPPYHTYHFCYISWSWFCLPASVYLSLIPHFTHR